MSYIGFKPANVVLTASDIADNIITAAKLSYVESALTDASTITWNAATQEVCKVTLAGNRTMSAPSKATTGQWSARVVRQDGTVLR